MSHSSETIRVGVIGCGHWGPNHIRVFSQLTGSRVVACADPDGKRRETVVAQFPSVCAFADHRDLIRQGDVDAVVVAAPTRLHFAIVEEALNAGKHVLCEKPLCVTSRESEVLVELAAAKSRMLMVGHVFLFNGGIVQLKRYMNDGTPGRVNYIRATRTNLGPIRADVNAVYDLATHDISILNYLLDAMPESVSAVGGCFLRPGIEDVAFISLRYPGNRLGHIQVSWLDPKKLREIVVVGDKQMLVWDDLASPGPILIYDKGVNRPQTHYADFGQFQLLTREGDLTIPKVKMEEPLRTQGQYFLDAIRKGRLEFNDGPFAIGVQRVLEAITTSLAQNGGAVPVKS